VILTVENKKREENENAKNAFLFFYKSVWWMTDMY